MTEASVKKAYGRPATSENDWLTISGIVTGALFYPPVTRTNAVEWNWVLVSGVTNGV